MTYRLGSVSVNGRLSFEDELAFLMPGSLEDEDTDFEEEAEAQQGDSCVTPGNPYVLHCFTAHKTGLTTLHREHLNRIAGKIVHSSRGLLPIRRITIIGHSATWKGISKAEYGRRALVRANNARAELQERLASAGMARRIGITVGHRADSEPLVNNMISSSSRSARNNRALNRRVEIYLIASGPDQRKLNRAIRQNRSLGQSLGWKAFRSSILNLLGFTRHIPNAREFAVAVARWQLGNGKLTADGVVNQATLDQMLTVIRRGQSSKKPEVGPILDYGKIRATNSIRRNSEKFYFDDYEAAADPFVVKSLVTPEGHERLTRDATVGFGLSRLEKSALRRGVRRVDTGDPRKHFRPDEQRRHTLRRTKCQTQPDALRQIRDHLIHLHRTILRAGSRRAALEFVGEAFHLIQDSYSEAHVERRFSKRGGRHPIIWIRFFGYKGSRPFPLEHRVIPPPDPRDIITTAVGRLKIWAREAVSASREYLDMVLSQLLSSISDADALEELNSFMDKHLTLSKFHVPTNSIYKTCP